MHHVDYKQRLNMDGIFVLLKLNDGLANAIQFLNSWSKQKSLKDLTTMIFTLKALVDLSNMWMDLCAGVCGCGCICIY